MMKVFFVCLLVTLVICIVSAELPLELEHFLNVELAKFDFSHFRNVTKFSSLKKSDHPHAHMNVIELGEYYNYGTEIHTVLTDDGYVLEMHRFTGNKTNPNPNGKQPILIMHGIMCSSMDWVIAGPKRGLAFILADLGYDVWMGNARGNRYSPRHNNTSISNSEYWDFSFHEMGIHDLPAMIDHILQRTGYKKIFYIGHSQGSTSFLAMLSERPEYNDKIITMFALAPVAYLSHMTSPVLRTIAHFDHAIDILMLLIGKHEFCPSGEFFKKLSSVVCDESHITQPVCSNILFLLCGFSEKLLDNELLPAVLAHFPAGSSTKQLLHYAQSFKSGHFRQFDYGLLKNLRKYKRFSPPSYKLQNVRVPISVHYTVNDWISNPIDVQELVTKLPNVIGKFRVSDSKFNHLDFMWGLNVDSLVYDKIISILRRQEKHNAENL